MSTGNARGRMTMRAVVNRLTATGTNPDRHPTGTRADLVDAVPCWLYSEQEQEYRGDEVNVARELLRLLVPVAGDVTEQDEITRVEDRRGEVIAAGPFKVLADRRIAQSHRELVLEAVT